jgi:hypothetical protein
MKFARPLPPIHAALTRTADTSFCTMLPQRGERVVRYFQHQTIWRQDSARFPFSGGGGGIVYSRAGVAASSGDGPASLQSRRADGGLGSRIYAQRIIDLPEASIFTILPELPSHVRDGSFFPALGTVAILAACGGEQRRLRAVGTDKNSGRCHGWIFDAIEEGGPGSTRS